MSQIQVRNAQGEGLALINIRISEGQKPSDEAIFDVFTDLAGNTGWPIPFFPNGAYTLYVNVANVDVEYQSATVSASMPSDDIVITLPSEAISEPQGFIHRGGPDRCPYFVTEDGQPWLFAGYSAHLFLPEMKKRDLSPFIEEAKGYGYNTLITIGSHRSDFKKSNGFYFDPLDQSNMTWLARMFDMCAEQGMRVAHAVCADMQGLTTEEIQRAVAMQAAVMKGRWNVKARKGNESNVNGYDPFRCDFGDLAGVPWSQGSAGEGNAPHYPHGDFSEWESRRIKTSGFHKLMDDNGAGILEQNNGYVDGVIQHGPWHCPIVMIEGEYFHDTPTDKWGDTRCTDPTVALLQGLEIGANCAGGGFGASDGLECLPLGPVAAECARQQAIGMRASFLR